MVDIEVGFKKDGFFNRKGNRAFFTENATGGLVKPFKLVRPVKSVCGVRPVRGIREVKPVRSLRWSNLSNEVYFKQ